MHKPWNIFPRSKLFVSGRSHSDSDGSSHKDRSDSTHEAVVVIGAGLAGCWLARSLADKGVSVRLIEKYVDVAAGASGNPAGIVKPFVTRDFGDSMRFHIKAHSHLVRKLSQLNLKKKSEFNACGVIQLINQPYPVHDAYQNLNANEVEMACGLAAGSHALQFNSSGWLNPRQLCKALVTHPLIAISLGQSVISVTPAHLITDATPKLKIDATSENTSSSRHKLTLEDGSRYSADCVVFTMGASTNLLSNSRYLPIIPARGQISRFRINDSAQMPRCVINGKCYLIPDGDSVLVGATFERHNSNAEIVSSDNEKNRMVLKSLLPELRIKDEACAAYAGVRATTPDRLPVVGPLPDFQKLLKVYADLKHGKQSHVYPNLPCQAGLFILSGLGSRGITTAAYCAGLLADHLCGESPGPLFDTSAEEGSSRLSINYVR